MHAGREEDHMTISQDGRAPPRRRPGPKPRGRTVIPLTITVTPTQRTALEALADSEKSSISMVVRRFIAMGLAAGESLILAIVIAFTLMRCGGACAPQRA
jgi:hypothetical protein